MTKTGKSTEGSTKQRIMKRLEMRKEEQNRKGSKK